MLPEVTMCADMRRAVSDERTALVYSRTTRDFAILAPVWGQVALRWVPPIRMPAHIIDFCPWCGEPFAGSLDSIWRHTLKREAGIGYYFGDPIDTIPEEFRSDVWWRRREIGPTNPVLRAGWRKPRHIDYAVPPTDTACADETGHRPGVLPHSCEDIVGKFEDWRTLIGYLPHVREYGIRVANPRRPVHAQPYEIMPIGYCPWCGDRLPASLRPEWERRLAARGLSPDSPAIPEDLRTDAWWRDEGL